jgi:hypothetical protein
MPQRPRRLRLRSSRLVGQVGKLLQKGHCSKVPSELNLIANRIARDEALCRHQFILISGSLMGMESAQIERGRP